ncbi:MAG: hypothetical protein EGP89_02900 [Ruminococcaceae bacterium]|nr:hypothetical protein [Oscillospiraceae bacterium]
MRKIGRCLAALSLAILMTSCSAAGSGKTKNGDGLKEISNKYDQPYQTTAAVTYNGTQMKLILEKKEDGTTVVTFTEPKMLSGMNFSVGEEKITVGYLGLSFDIDPKNLSSSLIVSTMVDTFNQVAKGSGVTAQLSDNVLEVSGTTEDAEFLLRLDHESGNALSLQVPSMGLEAEFDNFRLG